MFKQTTNKEYPIRRMSIAFGNVIGEEFASLTLFTDLEEEEKPVKKEHQQAMKHINIRTHMCYLR